MTIVLMGVSGCGKTSVGKILSGKLGLPFIDADHFHSEANVNKMQSGIPLTDADRKPWLETLSGEIVKYQKQNGIIIACSALKKSYRDILEGKKKLPVIFVYLKGNKELIAQRLSKRNGHYMPPELLNSQFGTLEEPDAGIIVSIDQPVELVVREICMKLKEVNA